MVPNSAADFSLTWLFIVLALMVAILLLADAADQANDRGPRRRR